mmetsp:Transcript_47272/g.109712  ORF Transcript_47272/g.109712 Transcript_47272/m.109712 type:complete len:267 (-) Transcript_47272:140-940(-)
MRAAIKSSSLCRSRRRPRARPQCPRRLVLRRRVCGAGGTCRAPHGVPACMRRSSGTASQSSSGALSLRQGTASRWRCCVHARPSPPAHAPAAPRLTSSSSTMRRTTRTRCTASCPGGCKSGWLMRSPVVCATNPDRCLWCARSGGTPTRRSSIRRRSCPTPPGQTLPTYAMASVETSSTPKPFPTLAWARWTSRSVLSITSACRRSATKGKRPRWQRSTFLMRRSYPLPHSSLYSTDEHRCKSFSSRMVEPRVVDTHTGVHSRWRQ